MIAPSLLLTNEACLNAFSDLVGKFLTDTELLEFSSKGKITNVIFPCEGLIGDPYDLFKVAKEFSAADREVLYTSMTIHWMFNLTKFDKFSWGYYSIEDGETKPLPLTFRRLSVRDDKFYHLYHTQADPAAIHCLLGDKVYDAVLQKILEKTKDWLSNYRNYFVYTDVNKIAIFLHVLDSHVSFLGDVLATEIVINQFT